MWRPDYEQEHVHNLLTFKELFTGHLSIRPASLWHFCSNNISFNNSKLELIRKIYYFFETKSKTTHYLF